jgi:hypothetical protein
MAFISPFPPWPYGEFTTSPIDTAGDFAHTSRMAHKSKVTQEGKVPLQSRSIRLPNQLWYQVLSLSINRRAAGLPCASAQEITIEALRRFIAAEKVEA